MTTMMNNSQLCQEWLKKQNIKKKLFSKIYFENIIIALHTFYSKLKFVIERNVINCFVISGFVECYCSEGNDIKTFPLKSNKNKMFKK